MRLLKFAILLFVLININSIASGQISFKGTIKGKIIEQTTKHPIVGATVTVLNTHLGNITDSSGDFTIANIPEGEFSIMVSYVGYQAKAINNVIVVRGKVYYSEIELVENTSLLNEITVKAVRFENNPATPVSAFSYSREEIFRNPGAQGDIFRAIGNLPGVLSSGAQYSAIAVRGQGTQDNVYMVDDIPMFNLSHLEIEGFNAGFNDPNGGRFSLFAPRIIDNAHFQNGGFDAGYGRKASSLLKLGIKEGNKESSSLSGQFDLLGFTLVYDGKSGFDKKTTVFASARYQNFKLLEDVINLKSGGLPSYSDYILKTTTDLNKRNRLSFLAMYNPEKYTRKISSLISGKNLNDDNSSNFIGESEVTKAVAGLNLRTLTDSKSILKNLLYFRLSKVDNILGNGYPSVEPNGDIITANPIPFEDDLRRIKNNQYELGYRSIFTKHSNKLTYTIGIEAASIHLDYNRNLKHTDTLYSYRATDYRADTTKSYLILEPALFNSAFNNSAFNGSAYIVLSWKALKRLTLNPSLRYDYTGFARQNTISPRISGSYAITDKQSINFASGLYYQDPGYIDIAGQPNEHKLKSESTFQNILGYKNQFSNDLNLVIEGWYKSLDKLVVQPNSGQSYLTNTGTGYAYGADISLTKRLSKKYYGQVSYSYMETKRDDHDRLGKYNFTFNQPHVMSALLSFKPNDKWVFSAKFRYAKGRPTDKFITHTNIFKNTSFIRYSQEITTKNGDRLKDFISLDLRADYRVQLKRTGLTAFIDVVDANNKFNQNSANFQPLTGRVYYLGLAVFPSFGLRVDL